jgi:glyoxylase-like metal-dependent hydrolase (beta-lactamase superfamily II)
MSDLTRRNLITTAAALPLAGIAAKAFAEAPPLGEFFARHRRITLGQFEVTTMLASTNVRADPQSIFGQNVDAAEFASVSSENFLSADEARFYFTPVVVNTGAQVILFDTGLGAGGITGALAGAGYQPDQIDTVVITHMHGDHIGGLSDAGVPTFPNATYVTGQVEYDHWAGAGNSGFDGKVRPLAERMSFLEPGQDVASGITSVAAFGHTPGHMGYHLESDGARLMLFADLANHPVWSLARPDWEMRFDMDSQAAAASRRRVLDMIATDRIPAVGYHMPFPALGFIDRREDGFRWVPESGQLMG